MNQHYYYDILRTTIIQFLDQFNDIRIARYDHDTGDILKYISVPLKFAPKSKNFYWEEKTDAEGHRIRDKILPIMAVNMMDVIFSSERLVNKNHKIRTGRKDKDSLDVVKFDNLVPYDITFELKMACEYQIDIIQILEQILPYYTPSNFIRITVPDLDIGHYEEGSHPLDIKVLLESSAIEETLEMAEADYRALIWTMQFRIEGYLSKKSRPVPIIQKVVQEIYNTDTPIPSGYTSKLETTGVSASKYPIDTTTEELSGAMYDSNIPIWYRYEKIGD